MDKLSAIRENERLAGDRRTKLFTRSFFDRLYVAVIES